MEATSQSYSPIVGRDRKKSISEAMQYQHPSRASSRRNTLSEKMPDLTPSHLNLVPPSPPMSPTSQSSTDSESESNVLSSRVEKTVQTLLEGYASLNVQTLLASLSKSFTHRVLPASLGMPPRNIEAFSQHAAGIFSVFEQFAMVPEEMHTDLANRTVTIQARMEGILKGPKIDWKNECVMIVKLSKDCTEVTEIIEFVDSHKALEMRARHAPKHFDAGEVESGAMRRRGLFPGTGMGLGMPQLAGERIATWAAGSVLLTCVVYQTFWGVRRWLNGN